MKRFFLSITVASLLTGCVIVDPPAIVALDDYQVKDNGTVIELTIGASPEFGNIVFQCSDNTPFDTFVLNDSNVKDGQVKYDIDSTFLLTCRYHDEIFIVPEKVPAIIFPLFRFNAERDSSFLILADRDTLFFSGDTVRTSEYIKVQRYTGGLYAPIPPEGYDTLLIAGSNDTIIVWQDYDRDGVSGYYGDDIFWVVLVGRDGARAITLNRKDNLTGYRGLDLCFKCMEGRR